MSDRSALAGSDVSRETLDRLAAMQAVLIKWNAKLNLIARGDADDIWMRHIADSAQIWRFRPAKASRWVDLGSGAGFPGLVVAALASETSCTSVTLVEADARKCVFLQEAARRMGVEVAVLPHRIETLKPLAADVVSARALAPLNVLLGFLQKHRAAAGIGLFLKGRTVHKELAAADLEWRFRHRLHHSVTDPGGRIVEVGDVASV